MDTKPTPSPLRPSIATNGSGNVNLAKAKDYSVNATKVQPYYNVTEQAQVKAMAKAPAKTDTTGGGGGQGAQRVRRLV